MPDRQNEPHDRAQEPQQDRGKADGDTPETLPEREKRPNRWQAARALLSVVGFIARIALWFLLD
ncbi:hypothetical protein ACFXGA_27090 [Actinosynnema sp. NPDC059335]|uniref:hypothetical protein n=1 Tax=Actinosynnema sp. NPDC059335 TaxID=3346804 RepID=UPI0036723EFA